MVDTKQVAREDKSGESSYFLWIRRKDIRDGQGVLYLRRWILASLFGYRLMLHKIVRADHDRCLHDHPWGFIGIILKGGYTEQLPNNVFRTNKAPCFINRWNPTFTHRIDKLLAPSSWTLLITGPYRKTWGFFTPKGWMEWKEFLGLKEKTRVMWCGTDKD